MVENDKLLRSIRLVDNIKIEIYQQGNKRKYGLIWKPISDGKSYDINTSPPIKTEKFNIADNDDTVIESAINLYISKYSNGNIQQSKFSYYKIVQDPFSEPFGSRNYGSDKSPYFLNNGCSLIIEWIGSVPNPSFELGTFSTPQDAYNYNKSKGVDRWLKDQNITSTEDDGGKKIKSKWIVPTGMLDAANNPITDYRDTAYITGKKVTINFPKDIKESGNYLIWSKKNTLEYDNVGEIDTGYFSNLSDINIILSVISQYKNLVRSLHGINDYDLKLCNPDTTSCSLIEYKSPIKSPESSTSTTPVGATPSTTVNKVKLTIDGLGDDIQLKALTNLEDFTVWAGPIPKSIELIDDFEDLAEYVESPYKGYEEEPAIFESQSYESEEVRKATEANASFVNSSGRGATYPNYVAGKHKLDMIPGEFIGNGGVKIKCCQIHTKPVNIAIADALLDMIEAAKNDGVNLTVSSGFRPGFDPSISTKSERGVNVSAQSQEDLYRIYLRDKKPDTAKPGYSRHGNGIAIDFNTGARTGKFSPLNTKNYVWMVKNSWRFGFLRSVASEEWHYEYWPEDAKNGPYAKLGKSNPLFFADLGLNNLQAPNWA